MSTTSLKLPDELKQRAAKAAEQMGVSPHAFMVSAIETAARAAEQRARMLRDARAARKELISTGKGLAADEVHAYLKAKVAGRKPATPRNRAWRD